MSSPTSGARFSINTYPVIIVGWTYIRKSIPVDLTVTVTKFKDDAFLIRNGGGENFWIEIVSQTGSNDSDL